MENIFKNSVSIMILSFAVFINFNSWHSRTLLFGQALGETQESSIKKEADASKAMVMQNTFREIYELYKQRVVSISTEQTVSRPGNPFFNDPFFREFFGIPDQKQMPKKRETYRPGIRVCPFE